MNDFNLIEYLRYGAMHWIVKEGEPVDTSEPIKTESGSDADNVGTAPESVEQPEGAPDQDFQIVSEYLGKEGTEKDPTQEETTEEKTETGETQTAESVDYSSALDEINTNIQVYGRAQLIVVSVAVLFLILRDLFRGLR